MTLYSLRNVFRKKRYYVGIFPTWADPPVPPVWERLCQKYRFFPEEIFFVTWAFPYWGVGGVCPRVKNSHVISFFSEDVPNLVLPIAYMLIAR